nr:suppressor APC domain-containing protein 2 [Odocoileus virginianus texanus]
MVVLGPRPSTVTGPDGCAGARAAAAEDGVVSAPARSKELLAATEKITRPEEVSSQRKGPEQTPLLPPAPGPALRKVGWAAKASEVGTAEGAAGVVGTGVSTGVFGGPAPTRKLGREADLGDPAPRRRAPPRAPGPSGHGESARATGPSTGKSNRGCRRRYCRGGSRAAGPAVGPRVLVFAPADEPRTVLERKPLLLGARLPPAGPGVASRNLEKPCGPAEAAPGPTEPERPQGAALERSPSKDSGAVTCRARELGMGDAPWGPRARGERRRHTITNGVDCDLLKQMRELQQEQEVLLQGLEMMARGREWYQQQLQRLQERQRRLGQSRATSDLGAEGSPRLLGQLLPKVQEVARCLGELLTAACAARALPSSSSGPQGPESPSAPDWQQQTILMLKEQNRLLTQEVTDKSERITQLEQEKSALIKQLFEARALSQQDAGPLDSTFM